MSCATCNIDLKKRPEFKYPENKPVSDTMKKAVEGARGNGKGSSINRVRNKGNKR